MGVKGLWELLHPVARPIKLETLANKRLAVDASIWLHQFMRGMRDKDGAMVGNAHIIGFFRRICKLLYYNIKPVFVFDGGTPLLKRQTIQERQRRKRHDANLVKRTAEKLLAAQLRLRAIEQRKASRKKKQQEKVGKDSNVEHDTTENVAYLDDLAEGFSTRSKPSVGESKSSTTAPVSTGSQAKRIKDVYILPPMETDFETLSRIRQHDERFGRGEHDDIQSFLDGFKKEDGVDNIDSEVFQALPTELQYEILSDIRLRSRVTSYERVQEMVRKSESAMDFSKLQVEGVIRRNNVTHKLLNVNRTINKIDDASVAKPGRIASQRNRQYILIKNEDGGWALGGKRSTLGTTAEQPVRLDSDDESSKGKMLDVKADESDEDWESEDDEDFEEVRVPGSDHFDANLPQLSATSPVRHHRRESLSATGQKESLLDHIEAYVDENESVEVVMAKFADMEDKARQRDGKFSEPKPEILAAAPVMSHNTTQIGEEGTVWPKVLDDGEQEGSMSLDTLDSENTLADYDMMPSDDHFDESDRWTSNQRSRSELEDGDRAIDDETLLDQGAFQSYWSGNAPNGFKTMHPDYKSLIQEAVTTWDQDRLMTELHSVGRKLEKVNTNDVSMIESLQFWKSFLDSMDRRRILLEVQPKEEHQQHGHSSKDGSTLKDDQQSSILASKSRLLRTVLLHEGDDDDIEGEVAVLDHDILVANYDPHLNGTSSTPDRGESAVATPANVGPAMENETIDFGSSFLKKKPTPRQPPTTSTTSSGTDSQDLSLSDHDEDERDDLLDRAAASTDNAMDITTTALYSPPSSERSIDGPLNESAVLNGGPHSPEASSMDAGGEGRIGDHGDSGDDDDQNEAQDIDLENEEKDFTQMFPDMAVLPGALVMPKSNSQHYLEQPPHTTLTAGEQLLQDQKENTAMSAESRRLEGVIKALRDQHRKHQRDADDLTESMITETQTLLRLFGIPYIVAPMEAEAQCADLQLRGVVDGILTEDSDVFLFGGMRVFKNMFKEEKYVECYLMSDVERDLGVGRDRLVALAYLLGSDYTSGIKGIGLVTAMEILRLFPKLETFAKWWRGEQVEIQGTEAKEAEKSGATEKTWMEDLELESNNEIALKKLANTCKKMHLPSSFPDPVVAEAYTKPLVDNDSAKFQWGIPDLDGLRDFLRGMLGWDRGEVDHVLLPIIRQLSKASFQNSQTTLDGYFDASVGTGAFQPAKRMNLHKSARLRKVVSQLTGQKMNATATAPEPATARANKSTTTSSKRRATVPHKGEEKSKAQSEGGQIQTISPASEEKASNEENDVDEVEVVTSNVAKRQRRTPSKTRTQLKVPDSVTAAKKQLQSKSLASKLAARNKMRAESEAALEAGIVPPSASHVDMQESLDSSHSGSSSSEEEDAFQSSHWDLLPQNTPQQRVQRQSASKSSDYAKARYGNSLRANAPSKGRKKPTPRTK
ncbi:DNA repair protein rad2 [Podila epigama]|nr:DNA repair protein rad2 [Podila epigama]